MTIVSVFLATSSLTIIAFCYYDLNICSCLTSGPNGCNWFKEYFVVCILHSSLLQSSLRYCNLQIGSPTVYTCKGIYMWHASRVYRSPPPIKRPTNYTQRLNQGFLSSSQPASLPFAGSWWWHLEFSGGALTRKWVRGREEYVFQTYVLQPLTRTIWCFLLFVKPLLFFFSQSLPQSHGIFGFSH